MVELKVSKDQLCRMASYSLQGMLYKEHGAVYPPAKVRILFETFDFEQCRNNGGPDDIIIPEYVPMELCRSVLAMVAQGYEIEIDEYHIAAAGVSRGENLQ